MGDNAAAYVELQDTGKLFFHYVTNRARASADYHVLIFGKKGTEEEVGAVVSWFENIAWKIN